LEVTGMFLLSSGNRDTSKLPLLVSVCYPQKFLTLSLELLKEKVWLLDGEDKRLDGRNRLLHL